MHFFISEHLLSVSHGRVAVLGIWSSQKNKTVSVLKKLTVSKEQTTYKQLVNQQILIGQPLSEMHLLLRKNTKNSKQGLLGFKGLTNLVNDILHRVRCEMH